MPVSLGVDVDVFVVFGADAVGSSELPHAAAPKRATTTMPAATVPRRMVRFMSWFLPGVCAANGGGSQASPGPDCSVTASLRPFRLLRRERTDEGQTVPGDRGAVRSPSVGVPFVMRD